MLRSDYGSSTVIVNNDTGEYLLKVLKDAECVSIYKARHIKEAIKSNNRLMINGYAPCLIHRKRIKRILNKDGIVKAACYSKRFYKKRYVVIRKITERIQNRREIDQT